MSASALRVQIESALSARFPSALTVREKPVPETVPTGVPEVDAVIGGLPRGALTEICGTHSSGSTSLLLSAMAEFTRREEACALVDASDSFSPDSAEAAGVELRRVLWVRCNEGKRKKAKGKSFSDKTSLDDRFRPNRRLFSRMEQALKAADLLLQSGGFGLVVIDLGDIPAQVARRVPLTSWFRFRRAVENTPTALVLIEQEPFAKTCAALAVRLQQSAISIQHSASGDRCSNGTAPTHGQLLDGFSVQVEVLRAPQRKPARSVAFHATSQWLVASG